MTIIKSNNYISILSSTEQTLSLYEYICIYMYILMYMMKYDEMNY